MADLFPTKTRLALLQDVLGDHCYRVDVVGKDPYDVNAFTGRRVSAAMRELNRTGWVELHRFVDVKHARWRLTDAGYTVLETSRPGSPS